jgi:hypothetical protein
MRTKGSLPITPQGRLEIVNGIGLAAFRRAISATQTCRGVERGAGVNTRLSGEDKADLKVRRYVRPTA